MMVMWQSGFSIELLNKYVNMDAVLVGAGGARILNYRHTPY